MQSPHCDCSIKDPQSNSGQLAGSHLSARTVDPTPDDGVSPPPSDEDVQHRHCKLSGPSLLAGRAPDLAHLSQWLALAARVTSGYLPNAPE